MKYGTVAGVDKPLARLVEHDPPPLDEANEYADRHGLQPLVASEPQYSLAEQGTTYIPGSVTISGPRERAAGVCPRAELRAPGAGRGAGRTQRG